MDVYSLQLLAWPDLVCLLAYFEMVGGSEESLPCFIQSRVLKNDLHFFFFCHSIKGWIYLSGLFEVEVTETGLRTMNIYL